jgi:hypothetical protein
MEPASDRLSAGPGSGAGWLRDIELIHQLKARYFRAMDRRLWDLFATVWTVDARLEDPLRGSIVEGRSAIVEHVRTTVSPFESVHHGNMPEIDLTGPDTARGIWAMSGLVAVPGTQPAKGLVVYGHYAEEYARQDGEWRISHCRLDMLRSDPLPGGPPDF